MATAIYCSRYRVTLISCGIAVQVLQVIVSIRQRKEHMKDAADPWDGRTLEWSTASPPPFY